MDIIKKYQNRRMYNTRTKSYIRLDQVIELVERGSQFQIIDIKSCLDITHKTLIQAILDPKILNLTSLSIQDLQKFIMILRGKNKNSYYDAFQESIEHFSSSYSPTVKKPVKATKSYLDSSKLTRFWQSIAYSSNNDE